MVTRFSTILLALTALLLTGCAADPPRQGAYTGMGGAPRAPVEQPKGQPGPSRTYTLPPVAPVDDKKSGPAQEVKVALLVPLTGESKKIGSAMVDAASLALFDKYGSLSAGEDRVKVLLVPKDTKGDPATAAQAAREAITEGAQIILGPLFAPEVDAVAPVASRAGVPVLTFSNNEAAAGRGVFLLGFRPEEQVDRVIKFAASRGMKEVAAMLPADPYGSAIAKALSVSAKEANVILSPVEFYGGTADPKAENAIRKLTSGDHPLQAIFLVEGGSRLTSLATALKSNVRMDLKNTRLLGTGRWDDPSLARSPALMGGWFASSPRNSYARFEQRFRTQYGYAPERVASLAYDAIALVSTLALLPDGPDFSDAMITSAIGFSGPANGIFRFKANGLSERGLAVIEVTPRGFFEIDPAPSSF